MGIEAIVEMGQSEASGAFLTGVIVGFAAGAGAISRTLLHEVRQARDRDRAEIDKLKEQMERLREEYVTFLRDRP